MASTQQMPLIRSLFIWASQCCYAQLTATTYEDVIRGRLLDEALSAGWTIAINKGTPIRDLSLASGVITESASSFSAVAGHNPDIRITAPVQLVVELKIRGVYGSAITRPVEHMRDDFDHVTQQRADVFILATDRSKYDLLRTGTAMITFPDELPDSALLTGQPVEYASLHGGIAGRTLAQIVSSPFGERVVAAFYLAQ